MKSGKNSRMMFERAKKAMPCGVASNFRYWGDDKTLVLKRAKGAYLWDQDDTRYIDYRLGFGPVIQGPPTMFGIVFTEKEEIREYRDWAESDHDTYEEIILTLFGMGVMPDYDSREPWFISASHTDEDAEFVLTAFEEAVKEVVGKR